MFEHSLRGSDRNAVTEFFDYVLGNFFRVFGYDLELERVFRSVHYIIARLCSRISVNKREENGQRIVAVNEE